MIKNIPSAYMFRYDDKEDTETQQGRLGRCYELGGAAQLNLAIWGWETTLVHGQMGPAGIPHCWLEFRVDGVNLLWDPILDEVCTWAHMRDNLHYRRWTRYTPRESAAMHIREGHSGPWGKDDERYDQEVARIDEMQTKLCHPDCEDWQHAAGCGWLPLSIPKSLQDTTPGGSSAND